MFAIGVGSPFWGPFMMKKLSMSLFEIQIYNTISVFSSLLSYPFWGRFIDKNGNKTAMQICIVLGGLNPMPEIILFYGWKHLFRVLCGLEQEL